jgi:uracil-DNA glycosylase
VRDQLLAMDALVTAEQQAGAQVLPAREHVLRALGGSFADVRVLLVGQDPYPTPGHAVGLSFSVAPGLRPLPRSLVNVLTELRSDVGAPADADGDLSPWADQGVLLLNRVLTVAAGAAGSHRRKGWEVVTDEVVRALVARGGPLVAVLWGRDAQALLPLLGDVPAVCSVHPSPLSASRGFFGSRPFSRVDQLLQAQGSPPVDWSLPPSAPGR